MVSLGLEYLEVEPWSLHSIVHDTSFRQNGRPGVQTTGQRWCVHPVFKSFCPWWAFRAL